MIRMFGNLTVYIYAPNKDYDAKTNKHYMILK
jgi:hypothetical protein